MTDTLLKIRNIVAQRLSTDVDRVLPDSDIVHDLGDDSLDIAELEMDVEDAYGLRMNKLPDPLPSTPAGIALAVDQVRGEQERAD